MCVPDQLSYFFFTQG